MGTRAIIARYEPNETVVNIVWYGVMISNDGTPDVVIPSLIQLRSLHAFSILEMLDFLIDQHPGGWHSFHKVNWDLPPVVHNMIANDTTWWMTYMGLAQAKRPPIVHLSDPPLRFNNLSATVANWAYVIVPALDTVSVMVKYPDSIFAPIWKPIGAFPLVNFAGPMPKYEVWRKRWQTANHLRDDDQRVKEV